MGRGQFLDSEVSALRDAINELVAAMRSLRVQVHNLERRIARAAGQTTSEVVEPDLRFGGMTVAEAAVALGIGEEHVRRLLRRGELVGVPYGGRTGWRLPRAQVLGLQRQIAATKQSQAKARRRLRLASQHASQPQKASTTPASGRPAR